MWLAAQAVIHLPLVAAYLRHPNDSPNAPATAPPAEAHHAWPGEPPLEAVAAYSAWGEYARERLEGELEVVVLRVHATGGARALAALRDDASARSPVETGTAT